MYSISRLFCIIGFAMFVWLFIPLGVVVVIYAEHIFNLIGEIDFAEKYMPSGGTVGFIKLLGLVISFAAITWIAGGGEVIKTMATPFTF